MSEQPPGAAASGQLPLSLSLDAGATLASFYPEGNELGWRLVADAAAGSGERQLLLHGAEGAGKTHLLNAFCHAAGGRTAYLPLDELRQSEAAAVLDGLASLQAVCLDALESVLGDAAWEQALFNLINDARAGETRLILAAACNPLQQSTRLPDLASRFGWGPVVQLQPLRDEALGRALAHRARALGLALPAAGLAYIRRRGPRATSELFRFLARLDAASLAEQRALTVPFIRRVLARD